MRVSRPLDDWWRGLPEQARNLPAELSHVDCYLDDERFVEPWRSVFTERRGRPSVPVETLLRMLYLKHRHQLGYESLCREVSGSLTWRRFCRIPLAEPVPHPTTLVKVVRRGGTGLVEQLNAALLSKLVEDKHVGGRKLRVDTTVIEADIDYPTDADLLEHAVRKLSRLVSRIKAGGAARRTPFRDRSRAAGRRLKKISRTLRRRTGRALGEIDALTAEVAVLARQTLREVAAVERSAHRRIRTRPSGRLSQLVHELQETVSGTERLLGQTALRLTGIRTIPDRLVSLADPDARPIRKGKPQHPTQFGYTALIAEEECGFVVDHQVHRGNPADAPQLVPAVQRVTDLVRRVPGTVVADRGFGTAANDRALADLGVRRIGLQRNGTLSKTRREHERSRPFRRMRNWRVGIEARISQLKRAFGLRRTRMRGLVGAQCWVGLGIFAYNLHRLTEQTGPSPSSRRRTSPAGPFFMSK